MSNASCSSYLGWDRKQAGVTAKELKGKGRTECVTKRIRSKGEMPHQGTSHLSRTQEGCWRQSQILASGLQISGAELSWRHAQGLRICRHTRGVSGNIQTNPRRLNSTNLGLFLKTQTHNFLRVHLVLYRCHLPCPFGFWSTLDLLPGSLMILFSSHFSFSPKDCKQMDWNTLYKGLLYQGGHFFLLKVTEIFNHTELSREQFALLLSKGIEFGYTSCNTSRRSNFVTHYFNSLQVYP